MFCTFFVVLVDLREMIHIHKTKKIQTPGSVSKRGAKAQDP